MNKKDILKKIKRHLNEYGFKLVFGKKDYVENCGVRCGGVFRYYDKELAVARGNEHWFVITLHEYCHFLQYVENCKEWKTYLKYKGGWWRWVKGESIRNKRNCFRASRDLELDCERRVVDFINKYKAPADTEDYILKANAMIFKYKYFDSTRNYGHLSYHKNEIFRNMMPKKMLVLSEYDRLPEEYKKFLDKHLKKKWSLL